MLLSTRRRCAMDPHSTTSRERRDIDLMARPQAYDRPRELDSDRRDRHRVAVTLSHARGGWRGPSRPHALTSRYVLAGSCSARGATPRCSGARQAPDRSSATAASHPKKGLRRFRPETGSQVAEQPGPGSVVAANGARTLEEVGSPGRALAHKFFVRLLGAEKDPRRVRGLNPERASRGLEGYSALRTHLGRDRRRLLHGRDTR